VNGGPQAVDPGGWDAMPKEKADVGLVLSGGGTRGVAHIGVVRALLENRISPDCVAGASAGAIVGALYAAGYAPSEMLEFFDKKNPFHLSNVTLVKPGIIDSAKVVAGFEEYFPENSFEALGKSLRVVATDLMEGVAVEFDSGPLIPAVLASSSFPLLFTPITIDGRLFVDGGIVSNFPSELIVDSCRVVIGVHVGPIRRLEASEVRSSVAVLKRALEIGVFHASRAKFAACDVVIQPKDVLRYGFFDIAHLREIEAAGYEAAVARMPAIREAVERKLPGRERS
jgi:NTE family protein